MKRRKVYLNAHNVMATMFEALQGKYGVLKICYIKKNVSIKSNVLYYTSKIHIRCTYIVSCILLTGLKPMR